MLVVDKAAKSYATLYDVHYLFRFAFQIAMDASALFYITINKAINYIVGCVEIENSLVAQK